MTESAQRELQAKEKQEAAPAAEHTKMGPTFTPAVDIFETDIHIVLLIQAVQLQPAIFTGTDHDFSLGSLDLLHLKLACFQAEIIKVRLGY